MENTPNEVIKIRFQRSLLDWFEQNHRDYPWRKTNNAFHILLAEICLQKTGAQKAESAYLRIIEKYPSPALMRQASIEELEDLFKPLGLTHRARLLVEIAHEVESSFCGELPKDHNSLLRIRGVGQYIANAILVFAYETPSPLVDEGIARVYRRVFSLEATRRAYADKDLWGFAEEMMPIDSIREYNWALLDLSALVCRPRNPICKDCPLKDLCAFVIK